MTNVARDGDYQSVAEKTHPQSIKGAEAWTALRWIDDAGKVRRSLQVLKAGVPHDVDYAIRVAPQPDANLVWHRVQRYPVDPADNGTHWQGPIATVPGEATYLTGHAMDRKNAIAGHGYGVDVKFRRPAIVDQFIQKLDPRP